MNRFIKVIPSINYNFILNLDKQSNKIKNNFAEFGYYHAKQIFPSAEISKLEFEFDRIVHQLIKSNEDINATWSRTENPEQKILHTHNVQQYSAEWSRTFYKPEFLEITNSIMGEDIILHHSKLFLKPAHCGSSFPIHQDWSYFVDSELAWVSGIGDKTRRDRGSTEFMGQGIIVAKDGTVVHIRDGAPAVKISGSKGEIVFDNKQWRLWQDIETPSGIKGRAEVPWPNPQFGSMRTPWCLDDLIASMEGRMDEPKNSGRRVLMALEAELGFKQSSARGGERIELPLKDRSLGLTYDWFR